MARTNNNPNQINRRTSILNSRPFGGNRDSILSGGFLNNLTGGAQQRSQQMGGGVPLTAVQGPQQPVQHGPEAPPTLPGTDVPFRNQQQFDRFQGVPVEAAAKQAAPTGDLQQRTAPIPTQPGGQVTGGVPVGLIGEAGVSEALPQFQAQPEAALPQDTRQAPQTREQELENIINDMITQQERETRTIGLEAGRRGRLRGFTSGLQADIRAQAAEQAAPFQRELTGLREREQRDFERNIAERQLALQEMNIRSQIAARAKESAAQQGITLPDLASGEQDKVDLAFSFKQNAEGLQELLRSSGKNPRQLAFGVGADADLFRSLKADLTDILARDRTGAVVGKDEAKTFRRILGIGTLRGARSSSEGLANALDRSVEKADVTFATVDPTGQWQSFLSAQFGLPGSQTASIDIEQAMQQLSPEELAELQELGLI